MELEQESLVLLVLGIDSLTLDQQLALANVHLHCMPAAAVSWVAGF